MKKTGIFQKNSRFLKTTEIFGKNYQLNKNQLGAKMAARKMIGNFVAIDEIHKDHVKKEQVAHKNWQKNHGYMIDEIYKVGTRVPFFSAKKLMRELFPHADIRHQVKKSSFTNFLHSSHPP